MPLTIVETQTPTPITTLVASGRLTAEEIRLAAFDACRGTVNPLVLWDGTGADISQISLSELQSLFHLLRPLIDVRSGGRTALLTSTPAAFGVGRWIATMAELSGFSYPIRPFRDRDAALRWLLTEDNGASPRNREFGAA